MKAIIPAAGYATRMYPLTLDKPKALLPVNERPVIEYVIDKLLKIKEIDEIIVVTNDKFFDSFLNWSKNFKINRKLRVLNDGTSSNETRLGTIGDIKFVINTLGIKDELVVVNSDNLFSFDLFSMYEDFKRREKTLIAVYDVGNLEIAIQMGNPKLDIDNRVIDFKEKDKNTESTLCSIGIYFFPENAGDLIESYLIGGNSPDTSGHFIEWLYKNRDIYGYVFGNDRDYWYDIGSLDAYNEANEFLKSINK